AQVLGLLEGGVDLLLIETAQDTLNLKATMLGARRAMREAGVTVPVMISGTIEAMGTTLGGQSIEALYTSVAHFQPLSLGLICATGQEFMTDPLRSLPALAPLHVEADSRPVIVGERTNVIGSKKFRDLISAGQYEPAAEIGRAQVKGGAQVIDICLANPDRDEYQDMARFLAFVAGKVRVPLMIDSTDARVIELALKHSQGKAIVNSINLEDGEER